MELFDVREMFEMRGFRRYLDPKINAIDHQLIAQLEERHVWMIDNIEDEFLKFPRLDEQFHQVFIAGLDNRFIDDFYELVSLIFHFHYRWKKSDEKERNTTAAHEHLEVLRAIQGGDFLKAEEKIAFHLQSARRTLLDSVSWE